MLFHFNSFESGGPTFHFISFHLVSEMNISEYDETVRVLCLFIFLRHSREGSCGRQGEGSVYSGKNTGVMDLSPYESEDHGCGETVGGMVCFVHV
jgi:hypothetical protein